LYVAYMRVMIVSCSYLLYEYLLKLKKNNCPRPCPRPRDFVLGLVLRSLASNNITDKRALWELPCKRWKL